MTGGVAQKNPRVVFATGIYPPDIGGPASYVARVAEALHQRDWAVRVVSYGESSETFSEVGSVGFPVQRVARRGTILSRYAAYYRAAMKALQALGDGSLLFAQDPLSSGLPASLAARRKQGSHPVVLKVVGDLAWEIGRSEAWTDREIEPFQTAPLGGRLGLLRWAERRVARGADRVITPSGYLANMVEHWGVRPGRIITIHNAPPSTSPRDDQAPDFGIGDGRWIASAGRLVPWKGFDDLVQALGRLRAHFPDVRLLIAGSGPHEQALRSLTARLELDSRVVFTGALVHTELLKVLSHAEAFVLASRYEGFSHLLLEAMEVGVPVLASRIGGNPELIRHETDGLLFDPEDASDLDRQLSSILSDRELGRRLVRNGHKRVQDFSWETMISKTEKVLKAVISEQ